MKTIIGPFSQILPMSNMPLKGALSIDKMPVLQNHGIMIQDDGTILEIAPWESLVKNNKSVKIEHLDQKYVALPGFIDSHTHICYAGTRAKDFNSRLEGKTYQEIAKEGGGIWSSVLATRAASENELKNNTQEKAQVKLLQGCTTIEVKSGYSLSVDGELNQLRAIKEANQYSTADLISTCLATHIVPKEFDITDDYVHLVLNNLLPKIQKEQLSNRVDIFVEEGAYDVATAKKYLQKAQKMGFEITLHADQFSTGGSALATELDALSADHLEASTDEEIKLLAKSDVVANILPGASIGLGCNFAPARKLLDAGAIVAIASDWNPGSAPNGNLLLQASMMATYEKLNSAELFAAMTYRAAKALNLKDRGTLETHKLADIIAFNTSDYREIIYQQGNLLPSKIWKNGQLV